MRGRVPWRWVAALRLVSAVAAAASGGMMAMMVPSFPRNGSGTDLTILVTYGLGYFVFFFGVSAVAGGLILAISKLRKSRLPAVSAVVIPAGIIGYQFARYVGWSESVHLSAAAAAGLLLGIAAGLSAQLPRFHRISRVVSWVSAWSLPLVIGVTTAARQWPALRATYHPIEIQSSGPPPLVRVKLVGIDGADLRHLRSIMKETELPGFQRILEGGASGPLRTNSPHSPVVWTTIATGLPGPVHGVRSYTTTYLDGTAISLPKSKLDFLGEWLNRAFPYRQEAAVSSNTRKVKAIWNVLSLFERRSLVVNWWATYPTRAIDGVMVSNHAVPWKGYQPTRIAALKTIPHIVHPPELVNRVQRLISQRVVETGLAQAKRRDSVAAFFAARDDIVFHLFAELDDGGFDFATVYLQGVDVASHAYTTLVFGRNINEVRPKVVPEPKAKRLFGELVVQAYRDMDQRLVRILDGLKSDECLLVVSDHGWQYDGTSHWTRPAGLFLAFGGAIRPGTAFSGASVFDVLPTISHLLQVPSSRELPGSVLANVITAELQAGHKVAPMESYGERGRRVAVETVKEDEAHIERLRTLGYVQ